MEVFLIIGDDEHSLCSTSDFQDERDEVYVAGIMLMAVQHVVESWLVDPGQGFSQDLKIVIK